MPELITKDGMNFWQFPEMPFDVAKRMRALLNYYLRTDPETDEIDLTQWAVYPNNATPKLLTPLITYLERITALNSEKLAYGHVANWAQMVLENSRWIQRLEFYRDTITGIMAEDPDVMPGDPSNPLSVELATNVIEPLFLGWYPNDQEPFSEMPGPYSWQDGQAVMDLYLPYSQANQLVISEASESEEWDLFLDDLKARTLNLLTEVLPIIPTLKIIPLAVGLAVFVGVLSRVKK